MRRSASALLTLLLSTLALAAPTADPEPLLQLNNFCPYSLFISDANPKYQTPPIFELATGTAYVRPIVESGSTIFVALSYAKILTDLICLRLQMSWASPASKITTRRMHPS